MHSLTNIQEYIKNFRERNKMTQKELADKLGCTYQMVQKWERGSVVPSGKYLLKIMELDKSMLQK